MKWRYVTGDGFEKTPFMAETIPGVRPGDCKRNLDAVKWNVLCETMWHKTKDVAQIA